jgi:hypothetical protein
MFCLIRTDSFSALGCLKKVGKIIKKAVRKKAYCKKGCRTSRTRSTGRGYGRRIQLIPKHTHIFHSSPKIIQFYYTPLLQFVKPIALLFKICSHFKLAAQGALSYKSKTKRG